MVLDVDSWHENSTKRLEYKTEQICLNTKIQMLGEKAKQVKTLSK